MKFSPEAVFPFLSWLPRVNKNTIQADMIAGFTGAVIVLPQGVAFAIIAGLPPEYGLYTAMITPIIAALFGSSLHLISGPTTAISIVVFSTVTKHAEPGTPEFISLALTLTFMAGVYQLAFGLARLGVLVNFVSHTVVIGFTAGAAILIATSQMKNIFGLDMPRGESFLFTWYGLWQKAGSINPYVLAVGLFTLAIAILVKKLSPRLPNLLAALIAGAVLVYIIGASAHDIKLVGKIPGHLPPLSMPDFSLSAIRELGSEAFAVALLGLIEAVSISRAVASKSHQRISGNQEFIGQGLSNIVGSFFSSYAGSGSFTRSGINYEAGAKTPMSALFAAAFLMLIVLLIAPLTAYLPVAAMGGVILMVAWNLIDFHHIRQILETSKVETSILLTTFFATLFLELEFAIYAGVFLSLVLFLARTSLPEIVPLAPDRDEEDNKNSLVDVRARAVRQCPRLRIIRIDMSVYFGSLNYIQDWLYDVSAKGGIHHVLIIGDGINFIDLSGAQMLQEEAERLKEKGGGLYFAHLKPNAYSSIRKSHIAEIIGEDHFFGSKHGSISTIHKIIADKGGCEGCQALVFDECKLAAQKEQAANAGAADTVEKSDAAGAP